MTTGTTCRRILFTACLGLAWLTSDAQAQGVGVDPPLTPVTGQQGGRARSPSAPTGSQTVSAFTLNLTPPAPPPPPPPPSPSTADPTSHPTPRRPAGALRIVTQTVRLEAQDTASPMVAVLIVGTPGSQASIYLVSPTGGQLLLLDAITLGGTGVETVPVAPEVDLAQLGELTAVIVTHEAATAPAPRAVLR